MEAALYHPEWGYYSTGREIIGRRGDYFTSVSVGPLFGQLLMRQFAEMWRRLGSPIPFTIVEQGAHTGQFAEDVLDGARTLEPEFFAAIRYVIVEPLERRRADQQSRLERFGASMVSWVPDLTALDHFTGVHFSNELLDAFPVHVVRRAELGWLERFVGAQGDQFTWVDGPIRNEALAARVRSLPSALPVGYQTEINLQMDDWLLELGPRLRAGWIIVIDYGFPEIEYYRPDRVAGTLSAYARHERVPDPLQHPGEIDLTAHVDFTRLMRTGRAAALKVAGFSDQHHFMVGLGRLHFRDEAQITPALQKEHRAFKTLMHPDFLGTGFKVLCFEKLTGPDSQPLSGFTFSSPVSG